MEDFREYYKKCVLCPRECNVNRLEGEVGICAESDTMRVAWVGLHKGEEPVISINKGSGTLFFTGCSLQCPHCQNYQISHPYFKNGVEISVEQLVELFFELERADSDNINLVTANHFIPSVGEALKIAKEKGLKLPVVYNSSGYEKVESLKIIEPYIDTFLIDLKTLNTEVSKKFCNTNGYAEHATALLKYLYEKQQKSFFSDGIFKGTIVRHLLFPNEEEATKEVIRYFGNNLKNKFWLSFMFQFVYPHEKNQVMTEPKVYDELIELLDELEIEEGFVQEAGDDSVWVPNFERENPFPSEFSHSLKSFLKLKEINR
ncbi:MAG: radical SAM protein [Sphaerochaetaceae bacterium]